MYSATTFDPMKQLLAIPLILVMLVKPLWPIAEYIISYDYIVTNLCENRDRPQLQCDGKCYLAKLYARESSEHHKNPFAEERMVEMNLFLLEDPIIEINNTTNRPMFDKGFADLYKNVLPFILVSEIIQPPESY